MAKYASAAAKPDATMTKPAPSTPAPGMIHRLSATLTTVITSAAGACCVRRREAVAAEAVGALGVVLNRVEERAIVRRPLDTADFLDALG